MKKLLDCAAVKAKRLPDKVKRTTVRTRILRIEKEIVSLPEDFEDLIVSLVGADGSGSAIAIYNGNFASQMLRLGLVAQTGRGSFYGTERLRNNKEMLLDLAEWK